MSMRRRPEGAPFLIYFVSDVGLCGGQVVGAPANFPSMTGPCTGRSLFTRLLRNPW